MSKTNAAFSRAKVGKPTVKKNETLAAIASANVARFAAKYGRALKCVLALMITAICISMHQASHGYTYGLLYLMAEGQAKSGRAGGIVFMRNGRQRQFKVPALVQNFYTQGVRNAFGANSSAWNSLTDDERNSWINAVGFFKSDRFGRPVEIKGKALFVMLNQNLANSGQAPISVAPLATAVPGVGEASAVATSGADTIALSYASGAVPADTAWLVSATNGQSAGTSRPSRSRYRLIDVIPATTMSPQAIGAVYVTKFGSLVSGSKLFFSITAVNTVTGQASPALVFSATVI